MIKKIFKKLLYVICILAVFVFSTAFASAAPQNQQESGTFLPVLMYHQIFLHPTYNRWGVSVDMFIRQMRALHENGYNSVTLGQIIDYVFYDGELPENPVLITFDDGYLNVYRYAFPVLEFFGFTAVSFVIGHNVGQSYYKDTGFPVTPKFSFEQARRMLHVMDIQSHSYDMHQFADFEPGEARINMLRWEWESILDYRAAIENDHNRISTLIYNELGIDVISVSFPHGKFDVHLSRILYELGVRITFGGSSRNYLERGRHQTLQGMGRFNVNDSTSIYELLEMVRQPHSIEEYVFD